MHFARRRLVQGSPGRISSSMKFLYGSIELFNQYGAWVTAPRRFEFIPLDVGSLASIPRAQRSIAGIRDIDMKIHLTLAAVAITAVGSGPSSAVEEQDYLPAQAVTPVLADGIPWSAESPNGRSFKLTLNKDGTGSIRGPLAFTLSVSWTIKGEAMCLSSTMMSKCLRFREIQGGFQSWDGDKPDLKFSR